MEYQRYRWQKMGEGREDKLFFLNENGTVVWGKEEPDYIWYLYPAGNDKALLILVLNDSLQTYLETISDLSEGHMKCIKNHIPCCVQYLDDGNIHRFDRAALVNINGLWEITKLVYVDLNADLLDIWFDKLLIRAQTDLIKRLTQLISEMSTFCDTWKGFSAIDEIKASAYDGLKMYRKVKFYLRLENYLFDNN